MSEETYDKVLLRTQDLALNILNARTKIGENRQVYHYTDTAGLLGIIENRMVWFSNVMFMNDPMDTQYGFQVLLYVLPRLREQFQLKRIEREYLDTCIERIAAGSVPTTLVQQSYAFSMTSIGDSLNQFRSYADAGNGYSIGFSMEFLADVFELKTRGTNRPIFSLLEIVYDPSEQEGIVRELFEKFRHSVAKLRLKNTEENVESIARCLTQYMLYVAMAFKQNGFEEEREVRLICLQGPDTVDLPYEIDKVVEFDGNVFKPRWEVLVDSIPSSIGPIIMGPRFSGDRAAHFGLCEKLADLGIENYRMADGEPRIRFSDTILR